MTERGGRRGEGRKERGRGGQKGGEGRQERGRGGRREGGEGRREGRGIAYGEVEGEKMEMRRRRIRRMGKGKGDGEGGKGRGGERKMEVGNIFLYPLLHIIYHYPFTSAKSSKMMPA